MICGSAVLTAAWFFGCSIWVKLVCGIFWSSHSFYPFRADTARPVSKSPGWKPQWLSAQKADTFFLRLHVHHVKQGPQTLTILYHRWEVTSQDKCEVPSEWRSFRPRGLKPSLVPTGAVLRELLPYQQAVPRPQGQRQPRRQRRCALTPQASCKMWVETPGESIWQEWLSLCGVWEPREDTGSEEQLLVTLQLFPKRRQLAPPQNWFFGLLFGACFAFNMSE